MLDSVRGVCLTRWFVPPAAVAVLVFPVVKPVAAVGVRALVPGRGVPSTGEESEDLPGREPPPAGVDGGDPPEPAGPPATPGTKSSSDESVLTNAERFKFFRTSKHQSLFNDNHWRIEVQIFTLHYIKFKK